MNARDEFIGGCIDRSIEGMDPEWKAAYEVLCKVLLMKIPYVCGDDFKHFAKKRGLWEPRDDHHWVGFPEHLRRVGWIDPIVFVKPTRFHNHMPQVTFYKSTLFDEDGTLHSFLKLPVDFA